MTKVHQTIYCLFVTECKLPDPFELNIKRVLDHLKVAWRNRWSMLWKILRFAEQMLSVTIEIMSMRQERMHEADVFLCIPALISCGFCL